MTIIKYDITLPYSVSELYELVCDLQKYPEFISWCTKTTVHNRTLYKITATLYGHKLGVNFAVSIIYSLHANKTIEIYLNPKLFRTIKGLWRFGPATGLDTQLNFTLEYEFINAFLGWTLTPIIRNEVKNVILAFQERAKKLYG